MEPGQIKRTFEIAEYCAKHYAEKPAFFQRKGQNWHSVSCTEYYTLSEKLALGLIDIGVQKGEYVATVFNSNSPQWNILDMALSLVGAIHVPVYPTLSDSDYLFILNQIEVRVVFVGEQAAYNKITTLKDEVVSLKRIYSVEKLTNVENYEHLLFLGESRSAEAVKELNQRKESLTPDDIVTIIYTSGTTGFPKGVMLSHMNLISSMLSALEIQPLGDGSRILSFLPLCHVYERTANYQFQVKGTSIFYCESLKSLMNNFREVRPHGTTVVPRVLEKIVKRVIVSNEKRFFMARWLVNWSVKTGFRFEPDKNKSVLNFWNKLAYMLVFRFVKMSLGGKIQYIGCGGAPVNYKIIRFFWACKMPVFEGYGLTEASPLVSLNFPGNGNFKIGYVGPVVNNVRVKIAPDGEILVKGPNVMKGYLKQEGQTREVLVDGWLHTGDIGDFHDNRYLRITGRKKQMFKTSYGKYIVPQAIESKFFNCPIIEYLMVIGEGKHCAGAVICPNFTNLRVIFKLSDKIPNHKIIELSEVKLAIQKEVDKVNRQLGKTEQIKKHLLVPDKWSVDTGELSSTLKTKRNIILNKYKRKIFLLYKKDSV